MARILLENAKGNVNLIGFGLWSSNINTKLNYVSIPILEKGEFVKGLYTASFNESLINNASLEKIKSLKAVTNEHWHLDNEALKCLVNHQIYRLGYSEMYGSINKGHADFVLKSFTKAPSLSSNLFGYNMKPIKGFKVKINDELRYVISKNMPNADALLAKLNLGLTTLKNEGLINHYYKKIGIINDAVKDWKALTCKTQ
ncbi:hypothetical protein [Algibacillus agarilyticus]|uniref:hypothetical protein n=1 Tax=Algibacillus agarilyticus TaxID=2234133 RepID=UPI0013001F85|nr:hypothetical protein [Algibacillus agarilyticus]